MITGTDKNYDKQPVYKSHPTHGINFKQPNLCKLHKSDDYGDDYEIVPCAGNIIHKKSNKCLQFNENDELSLGPCKLSHKLLNTENKRNNQLWYHDGETGYVQAATGNRKCLENKGKNIVMETCGDSGPCASLNPKNNNQLFDLNPSSQIQCPISPSIYNSTPIGRSDINIDKEICSKAHFGCFDKNYDGNQYNCYYPKRFRPRKDCYEVESIAVNNNNFVIIRKINNILYVWDYIVQNKRNIF